MSAGVALQTAVIDALRANSGVAALLGGRIWDNAPATASYPYLTLGPSQDIDDSAECIDGAESYLQLDVWTQEGGAQMQAKQICGSIKRALHNADLALPSPFALVLLETESVQVVGDPDDQVTHGIVSLRALIEG